MGDHWICSDEFSVEVELLRNELDVLLSSYYSALAVRSQLCTARQIVNTMKKVEAEAVFL